MGKELWMIYDKAGLARNSTFVELFAERGRPYDIAVEAVLDTEYRSLLEKGRRPQAVLVRTICPSINAELEKRQIPVWNSSFVSRICNHKGKTREYLKDTVFCTPAVTCNSSKINEILSCTVETLRQYILDNMEFSSNFYKWEKERICTAEDFVIKTADGHGGSEVYSFRNEADKLKNTLRETDYIIQPMLPVENESRDMRVYVLKDRIYAAIMRHSDEDFRANFSRGGQVEAVSQDYIPQKEVEAILKKFSFGMAGIDFILEEDGTPVLGEIEDVAGARMLYRCCPELDIVADYMKEIQKMLFDK